MRDLLGLPAVARSAQAGGVVLQARTGSRRLPRKVLADLSGRTILAHCINRLRAACVGPVIVATTTNREDDAVAAEARRWGAAVVRGPEQDVLERFLIAARTYNLDWIIRATADNPFVDIDAPARMRTALLTGELDHVVERGLPVGAAVEGVRVVALEDAGQRATDAYDREHVTPWLRRGGRGLRTAQPDAPPGLFRPDIRLTVDTLDDLHAARGIARVLNLDEPVPLEHIVAAADGLCMRRAA
jgi:spore coat polysaccharide biosynthesis protein SpsF